MCGDATVSRARARLGSRPRSTLARLLNLRALPDHWAFLSIVCPEEALRARSCAIGYGEPRVAQWGATICAASVAKGCGQSLWARRVDAVSARLCLRARSCAIGYGEPRVAQWGATICAASVAKGCGQSLWARRVDAVSARLCLRARSCAMGNGEPRVAQWGAASCVASRAKGCGKSLHVQRQVRYRRSCSHERTASVAATWASARTPERVRRGPGSWYRRRLRPLFDDDEHTKLANPW